MNDYFDLGHRNLDVDSLVKDNGPVVRQHSGHYRARSVGYGLDFITGFFIVIFCLSIIFSVLGYGYYFSKDVRNGIVFTRFDLRGYLENLNVSFADVVKYFVRPFADFKAPALDNGWAVINVILIAVNSVIALGNILLLPLNILFTVLGCIFAIFGIPSVPLVESVVQFTVIPYVSYLQ